MDIQMVLCMPLDSVPASRDLGEKSLEVVLVVRSYVMLTAI